MPSKAVSLFLVQLLYSAKNLTGSVNLLTQAPPKPTAAIGPETRVD